MSEPAECVSLLAGLAGRAAREARTFDWTAIQDGVGLRLPADYKLTAESLPGGWFRLFARILPPEDGRLPDRQAR